MKFNVSRSVAPANLITPGHSWSERSGRNDACPSFYGVSVPKVYLPPSKMISGAIGAISPPQAIFFNTYMFEIQSETVFFMLLWTFFLLVFYLFSTVFGVSPQKKSGFFWNSFFLKFLKFLKFNLNKKMKFWRKKCENFEIFEKIIRFFLILDKI